MKNNVSLSGVLLDGKEKLTPQLITNFSECYALAKATKTDFNGKQSCKLVVVDENHNVIRNAPQEDSAIYSLATFCEPNSDHYKKMELLKNSANLVAFKNGIAKIEIRSSRVWHEAEQEIVETYYVTRSGSLLCKSRLINGVEQTNGKQLEQLLAFAQKIWDNPDKFRKLRLGSMAEPYSLIYKLLNRNVLSVETARALFDIANHATDMRYLQAQQDLSSGKITQEEFEAQTNKILSTARKNRVHMLKRHNRKDVITGFNRPIQGVVDELLQKEGFFKTDEMDFTYEIFGA